MAAADLRIALVCPTIGQTRRGYERFVGDLFRLLDGQADVVLFKGAGERSARERVVPHLRRTGVMSRLFPHRLRRVRHHLEFGTFAAALAPALLRGRFDLVHYIDPALGAPLHALRRLAGRGFALLFTDAGPAACDAGRWADHVHCLTPAAYEAARSAGIAAERLTLLPVGVDTARFASARPRAELRRRHGISDATFVVLSVATVNRHHKRVDHLIEEVARVEGDLLLWLDGSLHPDGDPALLDLARARLGARFRHSHVPSEEVGDLFRMADVFVSSALQEPFGMAVVEAASAGLPVVTHDSAHFRWLLDGAGHAADMSVPGRLADVLRRLAQRGEPVASARAAAGRFAWDALKSAYLDMYRRLSMFPETAVRESS